MGIIFKDAVLYSVTGSASGYGQEARVKNETLLKFGQATLSDIKSSLVDGEN